MARGLLQGLAVLATQLAQDGQGLAADLGVATGIREERGIALDGLRRAIGLGPRQQQHQRGEHQALKNASLVVSGDLVWPQQGVQGPQHVLEHVGKQRLQEHDVEAVDIHLKGRQAKADQVVVVGCCNGVQKRAFLSEPIGSGFR